MVFQHRNSSSIYNSTQFLKQAPNFLTFLVYPDVSKYFSNDLSVQTINSLQLPILYLSCFVKKCINKWK